MRSAVVLMGGKSSRMGVHKGMLLLSGKPLFHWVMESVSTVADEVVLSVSHEEQVGVFDISNTEVRIALDERQGIGPMGGLLSGLKQARGEYAAVAPVDAPLIRPELYGLLFQKAKDHDGAVPRLGPHWEPLVAVYKKDTMVSAMEGSLAEGCLKISSLFGILDIISVERSEIARVDPDLNSFININTKEDLERAHSLIK